ncbi:MAG: hypothetical protein EOO77_05345 [Oxalobacteraceae bacterium]|nr:MAG: hypothetical protein EOO77_05345 [Oxalobacteraceae bacterium]
MSKQILTPLVLVPSGANTSGLQLSKLLANGQTTTSSPIGVDSSGNVVLNGPLSITIDVGSSPVNAASITYRVVGAVVGMNVHCSVSGDSTIGAGIDELELEPLTVFGSVTSANYITFLISCLHPNGFLSGTKKINYYLG